MEPTAEFADACAWIGRQQAFAMIGHNCSAAQAIALKEIKEQRVFERLGLTWEEFCDQYVRLSLRQVNRLIERQRELGDKYFRLAELAKVSPSVFRQLPPTSDPDTVEIDGEVIELTPENATRIRSGLRRLHDRYRDAKIGSSIASVEYELGSRQDAMLRDLKQLIHHNMRPDDHAALSQFAQTSIEKWNRIRALLKTVRPDV